MLINRIREQALEARKNRLPEASLLVTLSAEAAAVGKNNGNREPTDDEVVKVVQRFLKSAEETREMLLKYTDLCVIKGRACDMEIALYKSFLPVMLTSEEIEQSVQELVRDLGATSMKDMGQVMAALKERHGATVDMKLAAASYKTVIANGQASPAP